MTAQELMMLIARPVEVALLSGDTEIVDAGRGVVDLCEDGPVCVFGPARRDWVVTGVALGDLVVSELEEPRLVWAGQSFELEVAAAAAVG